MNFTYFWSSKKCFIGSKVQANTQKCLKESLSQVSFIEIILGGESKPCNI